MQRHRNHDMASNHKTVPLSVAKAMLHHYPSIWDGFYWLPAAELDSAENLQYLKVIGNNYKHNYFRRENLFPKQKRYVQP